MVRKRRHWRGRLGSALMVLLSPVLLVLFVLSLPIVLPFVGWAQARADKRKRRLVQTWPCGWCVAPLGLHALARADALFAAYADATFADDGWTRRRMVRDLHACCPRCGAGHRYEEKPNRFALMSAREFAGVFGTVLDAAIDPPSATMAWPWLPPRRDLHTVALTRDSVCMADDVDAPHSGQVDAPPDADVAAVAEALLRSAWLPYVGPDATWRCSAGSVVLVFGLSAGAPFVHRLGDAPVRVDVMSDLHVSYERQRDRDEVDRSVGAAPPDARP